jgi:hypothetical protein
LEEVSTLVVTGGKDATVPLAAICAMQIDRAMLQRIDFSARPAAGAVARHFERLMLIKGSAAELAPLSLLDEDALRKVVHEVAQHLGAAVDPRCEQPLRPGQVQHFTAVALG